MLTFHTYRQYTVIIFTLCYPLLCPPHSCWSLIFGQLILLLLLCLILMQQLCVHVYKGCVGFHAAFHHPLSVIEFPPHSWMFCGS